uniref:Uncharacterized protein n=1 Tax=Amphimedon queenslandica TaxID=400682 RepID=A0A1X7UTJ1_AMPQE
MCRSCFRKYDHMNDRFHPNLPRDLPSQSPSTGSQSLNNPVTPLPAAKRLKFTQTDGSPPVAVVIGYESGPKVTILTPERKKYGKAIARDSKRCLATQAMKHEDSKGEVMKQIDVLLQSEIMVLCSDEFNSVMLHTDADGLKSFSIDTIYKAISAAPTLTKLLSVCVKSNRSVLAAMISMIANNRQNKMCLFQKVISLLLYAGNCSKQVNYKYHNTYTLNVLSRFISD